MPQKKDTFYFQHDFNARNDEKILELRHRFGAEGYGVFWMVVETMAENSDGGMMASLIGGLSHGYGLPKERLQKILDCCVEVGLFKLKKGKYLSGRLLRYKEFRKKMSAFGKDGAEKRWGGHREAMAEQ
jgi:hypothetical protein